MECFTREQVQKAVEEKGYRWFEGGDYNLNIVGIRNSETGGKVTNKFDDCVTVSYSVNNDILEPSDIPSSEFTCEFPYVYLFCLIFHLIIHF